MSRLIGELKQRRRERKRGRGAERVIKLEGQIERVM
jgi:hypothetical protein